jgi:hypothetical protein
LRQALATQQRHLEPGHPKMMLSMKAMALLLQRTHREAESRQVLQEIERVARKSSSNDFIR